MHLISRENKSLMTLCIVIFINAIGSGLIYPVLPEFFFNSQYGLLRGYNLQLSGWIYSFSLSIFPLFSLLGMPVFGALSDQYGRKSLIAVGLVGTLLANILSIFAVVFNSVLIFMIARALAGICAGVYTVANAMISDVSPSIQHKMLNYRWSVLASILGFIIGPLLGGSISFVNGKGSLFVPFAITACFTLVNLMFVYFYLCETYTQSQAKEQSVLNQIKVSFVEVLVLFNYTNIRMLLISYAFIQLGIGLYIQSLSLYLAHFFHFTAARISVFFVTIALGAIFNVVFIQPKIQKNFTVRGIAYFALVGLALILGGQTILTLIFKSNLLILVTIFWICSFIMYLLLNMGMNAFSALAAHGVGADEKGKVMGVLGQIAAATWFLGALVVGYLTLTNQLILLSISFVCVLISLRPFVLFKG